MRNIAFTHKGSSGVSDAESSAAATKLEDYRTHLSQVAASPSYDFPESFINLSFDESQDTALKKAVATLSSEKLKLIIIVGIGGSSLGSYALYQACYGWADALLARVPKLLYLDALSPSLFTTITKVIGERVENLEEILVLVVSKSGTTTETVANSEALLAYLGARFGNTSVHERVLYLTDEESSLADLARTRKWNFITTPSSIGGRFSVFTLAHLIPLSLAGINTSLLLEGARGARESALSPDPEENDALTMATLRSSWEARGLFAHNLFIFAPQCTALGAWWRQLNAESLGKGGKGMLPTVSLGSTDLHSLGQFYLGGAAHSATTFVTVEREREDTMLSQNLDTGSLVAGLAGKNFSTINKAIFESTEEAYRAHSLPYTKIVFPQMDERALGAWMQTEMLATLYCAQYMGVNAFDQPNVEEYKTATRTRLTP